MLILGVASVGVFIEKGHWKNLMQKILFLIVLALPIGLTFFSKTPSGASLRTCADLSLKNVAYKFKAQ